MNLLTATVAAGSIHDWMLTTSATLLFWGIIGFLLSIIGWFIVRDRSSIKETLDRLVSVVEALRIDLAENYAKRIELEKLDRKVERLRDHITMRGEERRLVEDGEVD